jgi:hypothetical protein
LERTKARREVEPAGSGVIGDRALPGLKIETGGTHMVRSHPRRKDKDAPRVGHPEKQPQILRSTYPAHAMRARGPQRVPLRMTSGKGEAVSGA